MVEVSYFPNRWKVSTVVPVFKNFGKRSMTKNYHPVDLLWKCGLFFCFPVWFWISKAYKMSGATQALGLDISKAFDMVWHAVFLHRLKFYGISGQIFGPILSSLSNGQHQMVADG